MKNIIKTLKQKDGAFAVWEIVLASIVFIVLVILLWNFI